MLLLLALLLFLNVDTGPTPEALNEQYEQLLSEASIKSEIIDGHATAFSEVELTEMAIKWYLMKEKMDSAYMAMDACKELSIGDYCDEAGHDLDFVSKELQQFDEKFLKRFSL